MTYYWAQITKDVWEVIQIRNGKVYRVHELGDWRTKDVCLLGPELPEPVFVKPPLVDIASGGRRRPPEPEPDIASGGRRRPPEPEPDIASGGRRRPPEPEPDMPEFEDDHETLKTSGRPHWDRAAPEHPVLSLNGSDCSVAAIANLLGLTYSQAKVKAMHYGWTSTGGIARGWLEQIAIDAEMEISARNDLSRGYVRDIRGVPGVFIIGSHRHVQLAIGGVLLNANEEHHVDYVTECRPVSKEGDI